MIIDRYIGKTVAVYCGLVMAILLALFAFTMFVGELGDIGKGNYGLWHAAQYVLLSMPRLAYQLFPTVALLGSVMGLGILASNSELLVFRAAGTSPIRVVSAVMKTGLIMVILTTLLGETIAPISERYAHGMRAMAMSNKGTMMLDGGLWLRDGKNFIHVGEVFSDNALGDVSIYELGENNALLRIVHAAQASYLDAAWQMQKLEITEFSPTGLRFDREATQRWGSLISPQTVGAVAVSPEFLTIWGLSRYLNYLHTNELEANQYEQAFWRKIITPFATGVMVFLAVPFIFGPLRSVAVGQRVLAGTIVGISFYVVDQAVGFMGIVYDVNALLVVLLPTTIFLVVAIWLARRVL